MAKTPKVSVRAVARRELSTARKLGKDLKTGSGSIVLDSFVNFNQKLGIGADNPLTTAAYGYNPVTRVRTLLEWIHRGSWLGGVAVDVVAEDMTRAGIELQTELDPEQKEKIESEAVRLGIWKAVNDTYKWARLYGGAIAMFMVEGQDPRTPLNVDTVGKDQFKGLLVLDRWMLEPTLQDLVTEMGPSMGQPKFYRVNNDAPGFRNAVVHHSRCVRLEGISLPYWQKVQENLWGISVIERLYDRMVMFDSATTGAGQLVYKAHMQTYAIEGLREVIAAGGDPLDGLVKYVDMMRRFRGIEGMTLIDGKDKVETHTHQAFSGLSDALIQFGQQLAGALQIPLVRLFGQSPAGMNATGESDLRTYYDGIKQRQEADLRVPITAVYRMLGLSLGTPLPKGTRIDFRSLWQLSDKEKAEIAESTERAVAAAEESGLISQQTAMKELQASSRITGIFSHIMDEDIEAAADDLPPAGTEGANLEHEAALAVSSSSSGERPGNDKPAGGQPKKKEPTKDSIAAVSAMKKNHNIDVVIESGRGTIRQGKDWQAVMPYDYGYIRGTLAPDGEPVDAMIGRDYSSQDVFVVHQKKLDTGTYDEPKVMFAYKDFREAIADFLLGYSDGRGWDRIEGVDHVPMKGFSQYSAQWKRS